MVLYVMRYLVTPERRLTMTKWIVSNKRED